MSRKSQPEARQAIALNYDGQSAPVLSAKGDDELAEAHTSLAMIRMNHDYKDACAT